MTQRATIALDIRPPNAPVVRRELVIPDSSCDTLSVLEIKTRIVEALSLSLKPRQLQLLIGEAELDNAWLGADFGLQDGTKLVVVSPTGLDAVREPAPPEPAPAPKPAPPVPPPVLAPVPPPMLAPVPRAAARASAGILVAARFGSPRDVKQSAKQL